MSRRHWEGLPKPHIFKHAGSLMVKVDKESHEAMCKNLVNYKLSENSKKAVDWCYRNRGRVL